MNDYYVYEHIRLDNDTCFYVGKGRNKRAYNRQRNEKHDNIVKNVGMRTNIIAENLSEEEAFEIEEKTINYYVNVLGYGIDIIGFDDNKDMFLTNKAFGGHGSNGSVHSEEWREQHSIDMTGENNPAFGVNYWESFSEEKKQHLKDNLSKKTSGENNPMYGVSPQERMDEETYKNWINKLKIRMSGENNPNYGNTKLHDKVKNNPELRIKYFSRPGAQNGRARKVRVYTIDKEFIQEFGTITDCCKWIKEKLNLSQKINSIKSILREHIKKEKPYKGMYFEFVD